MYKISKYIDNEFVEEHIRYKNIIYNYFKYKRLKIDFTIN